MTAFSSPLIDKIAPVPGWSAFRGTLATPLRLAGRGLHTGRRCEVTLLPGESGRGVVFQRMQHGRCIAEVPATWQLNYRQPLCTALKSAEGTLIRTTEHLLAALRSCGLDDVVVQLSREELPILDGSARPWIDALQDAGRIEAAAPQRFIQVLQPVEWRTGPHLQRLEPVETPGFEMDVTLFVPGLGESYWQGQLTPAGFREEIAAARSFGHLKYAIPAILYGLVKGQPILRGAGPWSAAAIVGRRVIGGARMPDEFVRHKIVDMLGDLSLLGAPLLGRLTVVRPTHRGNKALMETLMQQPDAWRVVEVDATLPA
jgi:UDP-3-O-[3-hydroxymyristoyl] N-acetylglucosamine deacetylase